LSPSVVLLLISGLFKNKFQKQIHFLWWGGLAFALPIMLLGIVVYPRYLFPSLIFWTPAAALATSALLQKVRKVKGERARLTLIALLGLVIAASFYSAVPFVLTNWLTPNKIPFIRADRTQYLTEWSSGHGLKETATLLQDLSQNKTVAVATEGYFGSLPDGLLLYFHRRPVDNLYIEGIGQPVSEIPDVFSDRAKEFDQSLLVVNSHRLNLKLDSKLLVEEYCRPYNAPCLQVWDITHLVKNL